MRPARSSLVHLSQATAAGAVSGVYAVADDIAGAAFTLMLVLKLILRHSVGSTSSNLVASVVSPGHLSTLGATFAQEIGKLLVDHIRRHHHLCVCQFVLTLFPLPLHGAFCVATGCNPEVRPSTVH